MGIFETITIVLVVLKLTGLIELSWWLVLAPIPVAILLWAGVFIFFCKCFAWLDRL